MNYSKNLNEYINKLGCTSKELSKESNISPAVISRYRTGNRIPKIKSTQFDCIINGLLNIANKKNIILNKEILYNDFKNSLKEEIINTELLRNKLIIIINTLNISISDMSKYLNFDASYISRIKNGERIPAEPKKFTRSICEYIMHRYKSEVDKEKIANLIGCPMKQINNDKILLKNIYDWFFYNENDHNEYIDTLLLKLNNFNVFEYIRKLNLIDVNYLSNNIKSKNYYGIDEMKQGELDFFQATILSNDNEDIYICNDMPMKEIVNDPEFKKKWIVLLATLLKKGNKIHIIHNLDRPINELISILLNWIPLYMTGQISPYYLSSYKDNIYCHNNCTSGSWALTGECLKKNLNKGKYYLTNNKEDIKYYKEKSKLLFKMAYPLMKIYNQEDIKMYNSFLRDDAKLKGKRHGILSSLPIYTLNNDEVKEILVNNHIDNKDIKKIIEFVNSQRNKMFEILSHSEVFNEILIIDKEEFNSNPLSLSLSGYIINKNLQYTYDQYLNHIKRTKEFAENNNNYSIELTKNIAFKNIQIFIRENNWVLISKDTSPYINFVIKHPKICNAISNSVSQKKEYNEVTPK